MIVVNGPDVNSGCGELGRVLQLGTTYVAGVGHACSPIGQWSPLSEYSQEEVELMRKLSEMVCSANTVVACIGLIVMLTVSAL